MFYLHREKIETLVVTNLETNVVYPLVTFVESSSLPFLFELDRTNRIPDELELLGRKLRFLATHVVLNGI